MVARARESIQTQPMVGKPEARQSTLFVEEDLCFETWPLWSPTTMVVVESTFNCLRCGRGPLGKGVHCLLAPDVSPRSNNS
jgi:hypothetical protein